MLLRSPLAKPPAVRSQTDEFRQGKRVSEIESAANLRRNLAVHAAAQVVQFPDHTLLVVDGAQRALDVGVVEAGLAGDQPSEIGLHVLSVRQRVSSAARLALGV